MRWVLFLLALIGLSAPALGEMRVALVIGNSAYKNAPALANPKNDAEAMAASLKRLGFEVLAGTDLDKPAMDRLLQAYADKLEKADVALVFYAGHGLQVNGRNYLVPVDGKLDKESDLIFQAVALDTIQGLMEQGQRTSILILDACRDNPLARNLARSMGTRSTGIGRGLGEAKAGVGTLIVYATQPGNVALDGEGANSPFTTALLANLEANELEVRQVLTRVRQAVIVSTKGKQVPWDSSSLTGDFYFAASGAREAPAAPRAAPQASPPSADSENLFWQSVRESKNAADYKAYLARYPQGVFSELAKIRLAEIEKAAAVAPVAPEKPAPKPEPPRPPQRTTSSAPKIWINGPMLGSSVKLASWQECAASCVRAPACTAWMYWRSGSFIESCFRFSSVTDRQTSTNDLFSGSIRMTPGTAQPATGTPAAPRTPAGAWTPISGHPRDLCRPGSIRFISTTRPRLEFAGDKFCNDFGYAFTDIAASGSALRWNIPHPDGGIYCTCTMKSR